MMPTLAALPRADCANARVGRVACVCVYCVLCHRLVVQAHCSRLRRRGTNAYSLQREHGCSLAGLTRTATQAITLTLTTRPPPVAVDCSRTRPRGLSMSTWVCARTTTTWERLRRAAFLPLVGRKAAPRRLEACMERAMAMTDGRKSRDGPVSCAGRRWTTSNAGVPSLQDQNALPPHLFCYPPHLWPSVVYAESPTCPEGCCPRVARVVVQGHGLRVSLSSAA